jgi:nucleoside-diphosphate-sugar epimerase
LSQKRALILGCGYVGSALARVLVNQEVAVTATTRTPDRVDELRRLGVNPVVADVMAPATLLPLLEDEPHVVFDLVRPQRTGDDRYTDWGTRNVAQTFAGSPLEALVYLSSTSVYGRRHGEHTDELTQVDPASPLGRARAEAEGIYRELFDQVDFPVRICRVPSIYGPGRTFRQRLESGAYRRLDDDNLWVSRIHVDDLAEALVAAWNRGLPGRIYLICDDEPVSGKEYAELTASLLSLPLPPTVDRADIRHELTSSAFERRVSARRCSNRRMRDELGVVPRYPSVRVGLAAALRAEGAI